MAVHDRLRAISAEIDEVRTELAILDEQVAFQADVTEDARIRALVSGTPLADREASEAARDLERIRRARDELTGRVEALRGEQDTLLERLLEERG